MLRDLNNLEKNIILSTDCVQTILPPFDDAIEPLELEYPIESDPGWDTKKTEIVKAANKGQHIDSVGTGGTGVSLNPTGAYEIFKALNPNENDVIADFGSGTGRFLVVAAEASIQLDLNFRVIGIEVSKALADKSRSNTAGYTNVDIYTEDLTQINPNDARFASISHVFLANPGMDPALQYLIFEKIVNLPNLKKVAFFNTKKQIHLCTHFEEQMLYRSTNHKKCSVWQNFYESVVHFYKTRFATVRE